MLVDRPWLTVLMPAFNEEAGLAAAAEEVLDALCDLRVSAELLVADDCSTDRTGEIAEVLAETHPEVRVVHHAANLGIGGGMRTGIANARGEWLILIPADLAMDLSELGKYFGAASDADVVVGVRSDRSDYSTFRMAVSQLNIALIRTLFRMPLRQYNYISMYRTELLKRMDVEYWRSAFFFAEILIKARDMGARLKEVDITYRPRASGRATGANPRLIARTGRDMAEFWSRSTFGRTSLATSRS
jgi:glycosyltransferase involved in cell wall biosynthesis